MRSRIISSYPFLLLGIVFITLNIIRILKVAITHDEAITYLWYVKSSYTDIITFNLVTANNHVLNSLLTKIFVSLFGAAPFALRFANLLAQCGYIIYSCLLARALFKNKWQQWVLILLLNFNPFLFDFWGLCRGYGLSISLMLGSIYHLVSWHKKESVKQLSVCLLLAALSVYSSFSLLNYMLALNAVLIIMMLLNRQVKLQSVVIIVGFNLLVAALVFKPLKLLKDHAQLYYGGNTGLIKDTIESLIRETIFARGLIHENAIGVWSVVFFVSIIFTGILALYNALSKERDLLGLALCLLLGIVFLSIKLQNVLLGNLFVIERTALFLFPLFIIQLAYIVYQLPLKKASGVIMIFFVAIAAFNFFDKLNFTYTRTWDYDQYDHSVINKLATENNTPVSIRVHWKFLYSFQYYQKQYYPDRISRISSLNDYSIEEGWDYYYIMKEELDRVPPYYHRVSQYANGKYILLKNNKGLNP